MKQIVHIINHTANWNLGLLTVRPTLPPKHRLGFYQKPQNGGELCPRLG